MPNSLPEAQHQVVRQWAAEQSYSGPWPAPNRNSLVGSFRMYHAGLNLILRLLRTHPMCYLEINCWHTADKRQLVCCSVSPSCSVLTVHVSVLWRSCLGRPWRFFNLQFASDGSSSHLYPPPDDHRRRCPHRIIIIIISINHPMNEYIWIEFSLKLKNDVFPVEKSRFFSINIISCSLAVTDANLQQQLRRQKFQGCHQTLKDRRLVTTMSDIPSKKISSDLTVFFPQQKSDLNEIEWNHEHLFFLRSGFLARFTFIADEWKWLKKTWNVLLEGFSRFLFGGSLVESLDSTSFQGRWPKILRKIMWTDHRSTLEMMNHRSAESVFD